MFTLNLTYCPHTRGGEPSLTVHTRNEPIVPSRVGVNRQRRRQKQRKTDCPHTRGGEPNFEFVAALFAMIVPTRVGVNRHSLISLS